MEDDRDLLADDDVRRASDEVRRRSRVIRSWRELHFDRHLAAHAFDAPQNLPERRETVTLILLAHHGHEAEAPDAPRAALECRLEDVRPRQVTPRRPEVALRPD